MSFRTVCGLVISLAMVGLLWLHDVGVGLERDEAQQAQTRGEAKKQAQRVQLDEQDRAQQTLRGELARSEEQRKLATDETSRLRDQITKRDQENLQLRADNGKLRSQNRLLRDENVSLKAAVALRDQTISALEQKVNALAQTARPVGRAIQHLLGGLDSRTPSSDGYLDQAICHNRGLNPGCTRAPGNGP